MSNKTRITVIAVCFFTYFGVASAQQAQAQIPAPIQQATDAKNPSPELVGNLTKELSITPEQAIGGSGALFGLAQSRLKPEEFAKVSDVVPGMDGLLKAAPKQASAGGLGAMTKALPGEAGGLGATTKALPGAAGGLGAMTKALPGAAGGLGAMTKALPGEAGGLGAMSKALPGAAGGLGAMTKALPGKPGGLTSVGGSFESLGLSPDMA